MEKYQGAFPEIPSGLESSIVADVLRASLQEVVPNESEWEMLRRPLLGRGGYGEEIFIRFEDQATNYGYGLKAVCIKVFPTPEGGAFAELPVPKVADEGIDETNVLENRISLQSHEGNAIAFNDGLSGIEINVLYHERRGVLTFILTDRQGDGDGLNANERTGTVTTSTVRLKFKDPSTKIIEGFASAYSDGVNIEYNFVPTSSAQLILLNIAATILRSPRA